MISVDVYVFPRFTILPSHAPKSFVPYDNLLSHEPPTAHTSTTKSRSDSSSSKLHLHPPTPPLTPTSSTSSLPDTKEDEHEFIQASITSLQSHYVTFIRATSRRSSIASTASGPSTGTYGHFEGPEETIDFDFAVYALGSGMPDPVNVWREHPNLPSEVIHDEHEPGLGTKRGGVRWMERKAEDVKQARRIVIVGGGALGIRPS